MIRFCFLLICILISNNISAQVATNENKQPTESITEYNLSQFPNLKANKKLILKSALLPFSLISAGVIIESLPDHTVFSKTRIQHHVQIKLNGFSTSIDDYMQFLPIATLYGLKLSGFKSRSDIFNQAILTVKSEVLMGTIVKSMKYLIHDSRPDGSSDNSMPSGHTAQAFVSAALLDMEYRDLSPWISVGGYLCATATGLLRVANNRHWASDVLIGAGIGIGTVKLVYFTHRYKWRKPNNYSLIPFLYKDGGGVAFAMRL
jgi:membrane-associated phospholipid phosphatase